MKILCSDCCVGCVVRLYEIRLKMTACVCGERERSIIENMVI